MPAELLFKIMENLPWIMEFFEKIKERLKKKDKIVYVDSDVVEILREMEICIRKLKETDGLGENREFENLLKLGDEFFKEYVIIWVPDKRKYGIIPKKSKYFQNIIDKLLESKKKSAEQFMVSSLDSGLLYHEFKDSEKRMEEEIIDTISVLPKEAKTLYTSLIALSAQIEDLYKKGKIDDAEFVRRSIKLLYGEFGLKFCNLYQRNYLKNFFKTLEKKDPKVIEREIKRFFDETKYVFFIHKDMSIQDLENIKIQIEDALNRGEDYIAVHSLGGATTLARTIVESLSPPENITYQKTVHDGVDEKNVRDFTIIWYKGEKGERLLTYFLIKPRV